MTEAFDPSRPESAPAAADAAALQLAEDAPSDSAKARVSGGEPASLKKGDAQLFAEMIKAAGAVAAQKNISLTPAFLAIAANAPLSVREANLRQRLKRRDPDAFLLAGSALNTALDLSMAIQTLAHLQSRAGFGGGPSEVLGRHAEYWVRGGAANDMERKPWRWPTVNDAVEIFRRAITSGPVTITMPKRVRPIVYFLDRAACRAGRLPDAESLPFLWRIALADPMPKAAFGPVPVGPLTCTDTGGNVFTTWWRHGEMHRDPKQGPARHVKGPLEEWSEYRVDGDLHRDAAEGPAYVYSHFEGKEIAGEEYFEEGVLHRPCGQGPAITHKDRAGNPVLEIYFEDGQRHRDSKFGPAFRRLRDGIEDVEYAMRGQLHRNASEGPARISRDVASGCVLAEEYYEYGQLHRDPAQGPALRGIEGDEERIQYYVRGRLHRELGQPAIVVRHRATGVVLDEQYFENDRPHRADGPAIITRDQNGHITFASSWIEGAWLRDENCSEAPAAPAPVTPMSNRKARRAAKKRAHGSRPRGRA